MTRKSILLLLSFGLLMLPLMGQTAAKIGYVQSERIRAEYEEFQDAESQLQMDFQKVQFEYQSMALKLDSLKQDYDTQRLMSSPERRREMETQINRLEQTMVAFQEQKVGPEGELYRKQAQLEYEILAKVKQAVDKVAIDKGYDYIIDASVSLLYAKPTHDVTDDVLHELRKLSTED